MNKSMYDLNVRIFNKEILIEQSDEDNQIVKITIIPDQVDLLNDWLKETKEDISEPNRNKKHLAQNYRKKL